LALNRAGVPIRHYLYGQPQQRLHTHQTHILLGGKLIQDPPTMPGRLTPHRQIDEPILAGLLAIPFQHRAQPPISPSAACALAPATCSVSTIACFSSAKSMAKIALPAGTSAPATRPPRHCAVCHRATHHYPEPPRPPGLFWDTKPVNDMKTTSLSSTRFGIALLLRSRSSGEAGIFLQDVTESGRVSYSYGDRPNCEAKGAR
jgi:hypothetical protein